MCVLNDQEEAGYFYHDLMQLTASNEVYFFPSAYRRAIKYGHVDPANEILRTEVLSRLQDPDASFVIVTYPDALAERVVAREVLKENTLKISVGEKLVCLKNPNYYRTAAHIDGFEVRCVSDASTQEIACETTVAIATPATSRLNTITRNIFRPALITPDTIRKYSGRFVSPTARRIAAP